MIVLLTVCKPACSSLNERRQECGATEVEGAWDREFPD